MTKKILLAEDDKFIARAYKDGLEEEGFNIVAAYDGEEAWGKIQEESFDLILLDIIMPGKDGFEILEDMKLKKEIDTPVMVISNLGQTEDIEKAKKLGAEDYLVKSEHSMKDVIKKVKSQLAQNE